MWRIAALCLALGFLTGCEAVRDFTDKRYDRNAETAKAWLSDQMLPAEANFSGAWESADWGKALFVQNGRQIRGTLGGYDVEGVVSGREAYLLIAQGNWYYYSAILEMPSPFMLIGHYSRSVPYKSARRASIELQRRY